METVGNERANCLKRTLETAVKATSVESLDSHGILLAQLGLHGRGWLHAPERLLVARSTGTAFAGHLHGRRALFFTRLQVEVFDEKARRCLLCGTRCQRSCF